MFSSCRVQIMRLLDKSRHEVYAMGSSSILQADRMRRATRATIIITQAQPTNPSTPAWATVDGGDTTR